MMLKILHIFQDGKEVIIFEIELFFLLINLEDGTNIDNWTLEDLTKCVKDYYLYC